MMIALYIVAAVSVLTVLYVLFPVLTGTYWTFRGTRVVTCPDNHASAAVDVDARLAARTAIGGHKRLQVQACSQWPGRRHCRQACLQRIGEASKEGLVHRMLTRWYAGKSCVYCGRPLGEIPRFERKPTLLSPAGKTVA